MTEPILCVAGLTKSFGALIVTRGVDLDVREGEAHAVIGPNGAGKTSLVNQITGVLTPDAGRVLFGGRDVTGLRPEARARLGLARTFQISSVVPSFSARHNVMVAALAAARRSAAVLRPLIAERAARAAADAELAATGLLDRAEVLAGALAHGERRALELAMALVQKPRLLVLDEPMAGAGRAETEALTRLLVGLKRRTPMLLVEHDMEAVFALADRITVLVEGAPIASGTPDAIRADPAVRRAYLGDEALSATRAAADGETLPGARP